MILHPLRLLLKCIIKKYKKSNWKEDNSNINRNYNYAKKLFKELDLTKPHKASIYMDYPKIIIIQITKNKNHQKSSLFTYIFTICHK